MATPPAGAHGPADEALHVLRLAGFPGGLRAPQRPALGAGVFAEGAPPVRLRAPPAPSRVLASTHSTCMRMPVSYS